MNSFILSSIAAFCHSFANAFRKSGLCKLLMKIYNGISGSWKNSSVMTWIRNIGQNESNSVAVRIVRCPFTFLTFIKKKIGKFVESNIKNSFICPSAILQIRKNGQKNIYQWRVKGMDLVYSVLIRSFMTKTDTSIVRMNREYLRLR